MASEPAHIIKTEIIMEFFAAVLVGD